MLDKNDLNLIEELFDRKLDEKLIQVYEKLDQVFDEKLEPINSKLDSIKSEIFDIKSKVDDLELLIKRLDIRSDEDVRVSYLELETLKKRVSQVENQLKLYQASRV